MANRIIFVFCLFVCFLALPLLGRISAGLAQAHFLAVKTEALISWHAWVLSLNDYFARHAICRAGNQLVGYHLRPTSSALNLSICVIAVAFLFDIGCQLFSTAILGILVGYLKFKNVEEELDFPTYSKLYNLFPFALGMLPIPQLWAFTFYLTIFLWMLINTVVNMTILEDSIYDGYPTMKNYQKYVKPTLCILGCITGIPLYLSQEYKGQSIKDEIFLRLSYRLTTILILLLTFSVGYIYGVQRFSDDINFLYGCQPATYWKVCWRILPFGMMILISNELSEVNFTRDNKNKMIADIIYLILIALAFLFLLRQIIIYMKAKNDLAGMLRATEVWGPPNKKDRDLRRLHNPREETKYWRKDNTCTHNCLINSVVFMGTLDAEDSDRTKEVEHAAEKEIGFEFSVDIGKDTISRQFGLQPVSYIAKVTSAQLQAFEQEVVKKLAAVTQGDDDKETNHRTQLNSRALKEIDNITAMQAKRKRALAERQRLDAIYEQGLDGEDKQGGKTKRLPTYVPKMTPRGKTAETVQSDKERRNRSNFQVSYVKIKTYTVQFSEEYPKIYEITHTPASTIVPKNIQHIGSKTYCRTVKSTPSKDISRKGNFTPLKNPLPYKLPEVQTMRSSIESDSFKSKVPVPPPFPPNFRNSKSASGIPSPVKSSRRNVAPPLPMWHLPPNTPRPKVGTKPVSRSSSSISITSGPVSKLENPSSPKEASRKMPAYFMDVKLPPKASTIWPALSSFTTEIAPTTITHSEPSEVSIICDPILQEMLFSPWSGSPPSFAATGVPSDISGVTTRETSVRIVSAIPRGEYEYNPCAHRPAVDAENNVPGRFRDHSPCSSGQGITSTRQMCENNDRKRVVRFASTKLSEVGNDNPAIQSKYISRRPKSKPTEPKKKVMRSKKMDPTLDFDKLGRTVLPSRSKEGIPKPHPRTSVASRTSATCLIADQLLAPKPLPRTKLIERSKSGISCPIPSPRHRCETERVSIETHSRSKIPNPVSNRSQRLAKEKPPLQQKTPPKTIKKRKRDAEEMETGEMDKLIEIRINKLLQGVRDETVEVTSSRGAQPVLLPVPNPVPNRGTNNSEASPFVAHGRRTEHTYKAGVTEVHSMLPGVQKQLSQKTTILLTKARDKIYETFGSLRSEAIDSEVDAERDGQENKKTSAFSGIKKRISGKQTAPEKRKAVSAVNKEIGQLQKHFVDTATCGIEPSGLVDTRFIRTQTSIFEESPTKLETSKDTKKARITEGTANVKNVEVLKRLQKPLAKVKGISNLVEKKMLTMLHKTKNVRQKEQAKELKKDGSRTPDSISVELFSTLLNTEGPVASTSKQNDV